MTWNWNYISSSSPVIIEYRLLRSILTTFKNTTVWSKICWLLYQRYEEEGDIHFFLVCLSACIELSVNTMCLYFAKKFSKILFCFNKTIITMPFLHNDITWVITFCIIFFYVHVYLTFIFELSIVLWFLTTSNVL